LKGGDSPAISLWETSMNTARERERGVRLAGEFARPRNDDDFRWDAAERELGTLCEMADTRAAFYRVAAVAAALVSINDYPLNPDKDSHVVVAWGVEAFGDDSYDLAQLIANLAQILALRAND